MANQMQTGMQQATEMTDRDRLNDILSTEKYLTDSFNVSAREASHDGLHQQIMQLFNETHQVARNVYNLMYQKGWYQLESANPQKVSQTAQKFQGYQSQLPGAPLQ